ncbi:MAG: hypothetical protein ABIR38_06115 [Chthoniobacterales bacterium]
MDPNEPRIEIFAPFGEAFELTTKILFRPFDLKKWFVLGFAAWLATFSSGFRFNYQNRFGKSRWNWESIHYGAPFSFHDAPPWLIPLLIGGLAVGLALIVLFVWLNARGRFIFTDDIVRNRAAITEPWREFRHEGNRYFVFQIALMFCNLIVLGGLFFLFALGWYWERPVMPIALLIFCGVTYVLAMLVVALILKFMVPVMYRQRCAGVSAFRQVWALLVARPGVFVLFALFYLLLFVAFGMIGCLAACMTCCLAALPYLGTVILLPAVLFLFAYPLCFLRQFGDAYDVFAVVRPAELPPPLFPPVQLEPPPPTPENPA